ncbi:MAG: HIT family protein [Candidatus Zipacnadales bacterium]
MDRLWAPWRIGYVVGEKPSGCIFCSKANAGDDEEELILNRGDLSYVLMNAYPYNNGHLLVVPYDHVADVVALDEAQLAELMILTKRWIEILRATMAPDGFNVGLNIGRVAGAGIEQHVHLHIVPRWNGDTNFMPVLANTRVVPQSLRECYQLLRQGFRNLNGDRT